MKKNTVKQDSASENLIRSQILDTASRIMNQKGFAESKISEIAAEVGIKDPVIYNYFKSKEELLFSVVEDKMVLFLQFLDDQIIGISGAYNKLRKLVWAHLRFNDVHREYITLVALECRSNPNFYTTKAYKLIQNYARILWRILEEGIEEKVFRPDINLLLVRDLILGLMDFEAITCLVIKEIDEAAPVHEECMKLIDRILLCKKENHTGSLINEKRSRILQAAIKAFSKKGYNRTTISEIAQMASVADGTVYEYFKNKEDLLLNIPEEKFQGHLRQLNEIFTINDPVTKLRRFIQNHFILYLADTDFLKIYLTLILLNRRFYKSRAYQSLREYVSFLEELIQEGIEEGKFAPDVSIREFRSMFLGSFTHIVIRWLFLSPHRNIDKLNEINEVTNLLIDALISGD